MRTLDRITGSLISGALADAWAAPFEGAKRGARFVEPATLRVTDDTQLTMATLEAVVEVGAVDAEAVARSFKRWHSARRVRGMGAATTKALSELEAGGHWALVGASGERAAGNGAAMRVAPLAFVLDPFCDAERVRLRDVCRITHRNEEAYVGALAVVIATRFALVDEESDCVRDVAMNLPDSRVRERCRHIVNEQMTVEEYVARYAASGYVVDSVPLALLLARDAVDFRALVHTAVACGGDTDTVASMAAQIFGARHGRPAEDDALSQLAELQDLQRLAHGVASLAARGVD